MDKENVFELKNYEIKLSLVIGSMLDKYVIYKTAYCEEEANEFADELSNYGSEELDDYVKFSYSDSIVTENELNNFEIYVDEITEVSMDVV